MPMPDDLCPKCGMVPIAGCEGRGHIPVGEDGLEMRLCRNLFAKALRQHLGPEIANVQHVAISPLLQRGKIDRTGDNLFIRGCTWEGLLPHLKLVLANKGLFFSFRVVTDQQIKTIYVGDEHRKVRSADQPYYNSVGDFLGEGFDLVIVRLGYLGHRNRAAPGALKESLLVRDALNLPTWVVEDPDYPWRHSCNEDVEQYLEERYEELTLDDTSERSPIGHEDMGEDPDPDEGFNPVKKSERPPKALPRNRVYADEVVVGDLGIELPGEADKKKGWGR